jgi:hypothetical protein
LFNAGAAVIELFCLMQEQRDQIILLNAGAAVIELFCSMEE